MGKNSNASDCKHANLKAFQEKQQFFRYNNCDKMRIIWKREIDQEYDCQHANLNALQEKQQFFRHKNCDRMRIIWKREIDQEYDLHLASLRAECDIRYLVEERDNLISKIEKAQITNQNLRKDIRGLQRELYTMCHKNAHNSCVIDGLQELDENAKQTDQLKFETQHKLNMSVNEKSVKDEIISLLKHEISLMTNKVSVDADLIEKVKPHRVRLHDLLEGEKMEIHQEAQKFKRVLLSILDKCNGNHSNFEEWSEDILKKIDWLEETFNSMMEKERNKPSTPTEVQSERQESEKKTKKKTSKSEKKTKKKNQSSGIDEEIKKLNFDTDFLNGENSVILDLTSDSLSKMQDKLNALIHQCTLIYQFDIDVAFAQDYIKRLHRVRLKQETKTENGDFSNAENLEEMQIIFDIRQNEGALLEKHLDQFVFRLKEDFHIYNIFKLLAKDSLFSNSKDINVNETPKEN